MGIKNQKGAVSIENYRSRLRLRWRHKGVRYLITLSAYNKVNLPTAKKIALEIERDIALDNFDESLIKYKRDPIKAPVTKSLVQLYEDWVTTYLNMDCEKNVNYNAFRNMIKKWEDVDERNILKIYNQEVFCASTYNRRLTMLKHFVSWLVKMKAWKENPVADIKPKKVAKIVSPKRKPFTEKEISKILEAFKNDTFSSKGSVYKHSQYYPFIYFIFKTGVRNAEAIGLRAGKVNITAKTILINEVLARSLKGTSSQQRIRKETKNGKERLLPLTSDLITVLSPVLEGKSYDDLLFTTANGIPIDDNNFQKRIFKPILKKLEIDERVLYACRHTFGSRCIDGGITPVMTAFLMGNNPETALRNYTHQINLPSELPEI